MATILAYKKETVGNTVKFIQQELEVGETMYRHEITLDIYYTSSSMPFIGTYVIYSTKAVLTEDDAVKVCSMVRGANFSLSGERNPFYKYIEDGNKIRIPSNYGGGYNDYVISRLAIESDIVTVA